MNELKEYHATVKQYRSIKQKDQQLAISATTNKVNNNAIYHYIKNEEGNEKVVIDEINLSKKVKNISQSQIFGQLT